jgi:hypothetical protein
MPNMPGFIFSALPAEVQAAPAGNAVTVKIQNLKAQWTSDKKVRIHFDLQYVKTDGGNQQGRIVILARGPETLLAYPDGVLNRTGAGSLISPDQGEYFSVSRFREVKAEFGPMRSTSSLEDLEVLILGTTSGQSAMHGQLLIHELVTPEAPASTPKPKQAPKKAAPPKTTEGTPGAEAPKATEGRPSEDSQPIAPGYDQ